MKLNTLHFTIILVAAGAMNTWAQGQNDQKSGTKTDPADQRKTCLDAKDIKAPQVYGVWTARFVNPPEGLPANATMLLQRHAEFSDSLAGTVSRNFGTAAGSPKIAGHAAKAFLAGDLEEGILILDESSDNLSITGTWNGELVPGSCGKVFKGTWKDTSKSAPADSADVPFTLTFQR